MEPATRSVVELAMTVLELELEQESSSSVEVLAGEQTSCEFVAEEQTRSVCLEQEQQLITGELMTWELTLLGQR